MSEPLTKTSQVQPVEPNPAETKSAEAMQPDMPGGPNQVESEEPQGPAGGKTAAPKPRRPLTRQDIVR